MAWVSFLNLPRGKCEVDRWESSVRKSRNQAKQKRNPTRLNERIWQGRPREKDRIAGVLVNGRVPQNQNILFPTINNNRDQIICALSLSTCSYWVTVNEFRWIQFFSLFLFWKRFNFCGYSNNRELCDTSARNAKRNCLGIIPGDATAEKQKILKLPFVTFETYQFFSIWPFGFVLRWFKVLRSSKESEVSALV